MATEVKEDFTTPLTTPVKKPWEQVLAEEVSSLIGSLTSPVIDRLLDHVGPVFITDIDSPYKAWQCGATTGNRLATPDVLVFKEAAKSTNSLLQSFSEEADASGKETQLGNSVVRAFPNLDDMQLPSADLGESAEPMLRGCATCTSVLFADATVGHCKKCRVQRRPQPSCSLAPSSEGTCPSQGKKPAPKRKRAAGAPGPKAKAGASKRSRSCLAPAQQQHPLRPPLHPGLPVPIQAQLHKPGGGSLGQARAPAATAAGGRGQNSAPVPGTGGSWGASAVQERPRHHHQQPSLADLELPEDGLVGGAFASPDLFSLDWLQLPCGPGVFGASGGPPPHTAAHGMTAGTAAASAAPGAAGAPDPLPPHPRRPRSSAQRRRRRARFVTLPHLTPGEPGWKLAMPCTGSAAPQQQQQQQGPAPKFKVKLPAAVQQQLQQQKQQQQQRGGPACNGPAQGPASASGLPSLARKRKQPDGEQGPSQQQARPPPALRAGEGLAGRVAAAPGQPLRLGGSGRGPLPNQAPLGGLLPLTRPAAANGSGVGRANSGAPRWPARAAMQPLQPGLHSLGWAAPAPQQPLGGPGHSGGSSNGTARAAAQPVPQPLRAHGSAATTQLGLGQQPPIAGLYALPHAQYPPTAEEIQRQCGDVPRISMFKGAGPPPLAKALGARAPWEGSL